MSAVVIPDTYTLHVPEDGQIHPHYIAVGDVVLFHGWVKPARIVEVENVGWKGEDRRFTVDIIGTAGKPRTTKFVALWDVVHPCSQVVVPRGSAVES